MNDETASETDSFQSFQSNRETNGSASDQEGVLVFGSDLPPSHTEIVKSRLDDELSADDDNPTNVGKYNAK